MISFVYSDQFLRALDNLNQGELHLTLPNGQSYQFGNHHGDVDARLVIHDWRAVGKIVTKGSIGLAECYRDGLVDTDDLTKVIRLAIQNTKPLASIYYGNRLTRVLSKILYFLRANTLKGSKRNIPAHYDLGNDFYSLWLDPSMTYSAALFNQPEESLQLAQQNKYDRIINQLGNTDRLLEIGCGWGGFAERFATKVGTDYKGITLSPSQQQYAQQRINNKSIFSLEDYRHQTGKYDSIVSIEMFEAVGERYWPTYFQKLKALLADRGTAIIQTITINDDNFVRYRESADMIRSFIFPGGMLPAPNRFKYLAQQSGLQVHDSFAFGQHYAKTLHHWLNNFDAQKKNLEALGFEQDFMRMWRFYLAYCIAGFMESRVNVYQFELHHD